jgi:hypothetical protein
MMATPAKRLSCADHACTSAPMALALATKVAKTVENPATKRSAASTFPRTRGSGRSSASRSKEVPARYTR